MNNIKQFHTHFYARTRARFKSGQRWKCPKGFTGNKTSGPLPNRSITKTPDAEPTRRVAASLGDLSLCQQPPRHSGDTGGAVVKARYIVSN